MIATFKPSSIPSVNPISRWEDDGGPGPATANPSPSSPRSVNVGGTERALSALAGGSLLAYGLSRRSLPGLLTAIVGGGLVYRGVTGHCRLYETLGVSTADDASRQRACPAGAARSQPEPAQSVDTQSGASLAGTSLASGPVEYRSSATPPMPAATESAVVPRQKSDLVANPHPASLANREQDRATAATPSNQPPVPELPASHPAERHVEGASAAEPQGRT
jgi:hypothetical protein